MSWFRCYVILRVDEVDFSLKSFSSSVEFADTWRQFPLQEGEPETHTDIVHMNTWTTSVFSFALWKSLVENLFRHQIKFCGIRTETQASILVSACRHVIQRTSTVSVPDQAGVLTTWVDIGSRIWSRPADWSPSRAGCYTAGLCSDQNLQDSADPEPPGEPSEPASTWTPRLESTNHDLELDGHTHTNKLWVGLLMFYDSFLQIKMVSVWVSRCTGLGLLDHWSISSDS